MCLKILRLQLTEFIRRNCEQYLDPGELKTVLTTLEILAMLMDDAIERNADTFAKYVEGWIGPSLVYSVVWGIGGILNSDSRVKFDQHFREVMHTIAG